MSYLSLSLYIYIYMYSCASCELLVSLSFHDFNVHNSRASVSNISRSRVMTCLRVSTSKRLLSMV